MKITIETLVRAPVEDVWRAWTTPADIMQWNTASDDWHTTSATVDLRIGGTFSSRMEAKDGSMGFDFAGTYTKIVVNELIECSFGDRTLRVEFIDGAAGVTVRETFDAEATHSVEQQREGWQAILNNFGRHVEGRRRGSNMTTGTVRLHRVLRAKPEKLYRAFLEADAISKWLPPHGFTCTVHHMDAVIGGTFKMSFRNFSTGRGHSFGGEYRELTPNESIRYTDRFDDPNLPGEMQVSVSLKKVACGTEISIIQEGIPAAIPVEMCYLGWQESLGQLAQLVEPEIPE